MNNGFGVIAVAISLVALISFLIGVYSGIDMARNEAALNGVGHYVVDEIGSSKFEWIQANEERDIK